MRRINVNAICNPRIADDKMRVSKQDLTAECVIHWRCPQFKRFLWLKKIANYYQAVSAVEIEYHIAEQTYWHHDVEWRNDESIKKTRAEFDEIIDSNLDNDSYCCTRTTSHQALNINKSEISFVNLMQYPSQIHGKPNLFLAIILEEAGHWRPHRYAMELLVNFRNWREEAKLAVILNRKEKEILCLTCLGILGWSIWISWNAKGKTRFCSQGWTIDFNLAILHIPRNLLFMFHVLAPDIIDQEKATISPLVSSTHYPPRQIQQQTVSSIPH